MFYALLAIFPAITAFVSSYGLFANAAAIQDNLSLLANVLPAGGISIVQEQIARIAASRAGSASVLPLACCWRCGAPTLASRR